MEPESDMMCCEALIAECLSCLESTTVANYCEQHPETVGCKSEVSVLPEDDPVVCCFAYNSECMACSEGVDEVTWCKAHKDFDGPGCDHASLTDSSGMIDEDPGVICCEALIPECMACEAGQDVSEFCLEKAHWDMEGCEEYHDVPQSNPNGPCCKAYTAECMSCTFGESVGAYCQYHPNVVQCPEWLAFSKESLAADSRSRIDKWIEETAGLNEFGDEMGTMYLGGNPLFDETTGEVYDLYEYVAMQHDDAPWMVGENANVAASNPALITDSDGDAPVMLAVVGGVGGAVFAGAILTVYALNRRKNFKNKGGTKLDEMTDSDTDSAGDGNEMVEMGEAEARVIV